MLAATHTWIAVPFNCFVCPHELCIPEFMLKLKLRGVMFQLKDLEPYTQNPKSFGFRVPINTPTPPDARYMRRLLPSLLPSSLL